MKIIFAGTTGFGIPSLEKISAFEGKYQIVAVITQPDRPVGRKKELSPSPVKLWAQKNSIPILQPEKITDCRLRITDIHPDLLLVAAYGQIIPKQILDMPKYGSINIHGSLLPKYRGASPIQNAILNGDAETGITLIQMDEKMDHGSIIAHIALVIGHDDDYKKLHDKLALTASDLIAQTLPKWFAGEIKPKAQDEALATYTKLFSLSDGKIQWTDQASKISRKIRALNPEPGAWTTLDGKSVKILETEIVNETKIELPGKLYRSGKNFVVKCQDKSLEIKMVQTEGKTAMSGSDFLNGIKKLETKIFV